MHKSSYNHDFFFFQVLNVDRDQQVMEFLFQLAAYSYPDTITLPKDYVPPKMAIMSAYWKAWQILVLLCAHNPSGFGGYAWKNYPTLRALMEMCITNQFQFPPPTLASGEQVCLSLVWPHFKRTLLHILPGIPLGSKPVTSNLKTFEVFWSVE